MKTDKHQSCEMANDTSLYDGPSKSEVYDSFVSLYSDLVADLGSPKWLLYLFGIQLDSKVP